MDAYIDLSRRFRTVEETELAEPEHLAELQDYGTFGTLDWQDLNRNPRVVLIAEAGSGKSREMNTQVDVLRKAGKAAFYFPLESLARESPSAYLSADDERDFDAWRSEETAPG